MKTSLYFKYSLRSLLRGGQHTVLAIFCIAVGVMAIVSLQLVGSMVNAAYTADVRDANGNLAPSGYIVNVADIGSIVDQYLGNFLLILTAIASFLLLAGIIIANAVALAMLERRREIGILKAVGYTSGTVLRQVLIENGVVGGTSALLATLLIALALSFLDHYIFGGVGLGVRLLPVLLLIGGAALLAMGTALLVAWGSVRVRPLEVLRYE